MGTVAGFIRESIMLLVVSAVLSSIVRPRLICRPCRGSVGCMRSCTGSWDLCGRTSTPCVRMVCGYVCCASDV